MTVFANIYLNKNDTLPVFKGTFAGPNSIKRIATLAAPTVLVGLYVRSITGSLDVVIKTRTNPGVEKTMVTFDTITAPTTELLLDKVINAFQVVEFYATYTGTVDFELWVKGAEGAETPIFATRPLPIDLEELGEPKRYRFNGITTPGVEQTVIDTTVAAGKQLRIAQLYAVCRTEGRFRVEYDGGNEGHGMTGPASPIGYLEFEPRLRAEAAKNVKVYFRAVAGVAPRPLDVYLRGNERDV